MGLGDYQHDFEFEGEFDPWMQALWPKLNNLLGVQTESTRSNELLPPVYTVECLGEAETDSTLS